LQLQQQLNPSVDAEPRRAEGRLWVQLVLSVAEPEETLALHYHAGQEASKNDGWEVLQPVTGDIC
jgi:hypothetical protein